VKGNVAQLVEHRLCKAEVAGSKPVVSTLLFVFSFKRDKIRKGSISIAFAFGRSNELRLTVET
jgi:hypothetical protein